MADEQPDESQNQTEDAKDLIKLKKYRDDVEGYILEGEKNYNTTITYVAAGALGLFLTINEKFFHLLQGQGSIYLFLSIICLILSILLYISNTILEYRISDELRTEADTMLQNKKYDRKKLTDKWQKYFNKSRWWSHLRFVLLILGIIFEIIFILPNLFGNKSEKDNQPNTIKIEIQDFKGNISVQFDSIHNKISIQNKK